MTAIQLPCDRCGNTIVSDPHFPHEPGCNSDRCTCDTWVCFGCCWECNPIPDSILLDESDAPAARGVPAGASSGDGSAATPAGPPTGDAASLDHSQTSPSPDTSDARTRSARPPAGSAISHSPQTNRNAPAAAEPSAGA